MIRIFGEITLYLALFFACIQGVVPLWGYWRIKPHALAIARPSAWGQFICLIIAYLLLTIAFANNDFSIAYVAANSHASLPLMYRLTAAWGAHEGSMLLWVLILSIWTVALSILYPRMTTRPDYRGLSLILAVLGLMSFCFLSFLLFTSNPFLAATSIQTGKDLNPLLQDPGFVTHPPMLYTGYVGFSVAFAITQAALIRNKLDVTWATITRQFAIAAWCFLTLGIALGSWWAYRVLGWGGFWFWDPVENASLLPWLSGTALIHVLIVVEKRDIAKGWAALLALICFALSLLGTFLVRSGVLISAHTFANDPERGVFLLLLLTILASAALATYMIRLPQLPRLCKGQFQLLSRETGLLLNSALLFTAMLTVLLGTLYPLLIDALQLGTISVGAPYFNSVMAPLALIIMAFMSIGPLCRFEHQPLALLWRGATKKLLVSAIIAIAILWYFTQALNIMTILSLTLSFWIILCTFPFLRFLPSMTLAHVGFAIMIIGIMLSSLLNEEREVRMKPGDTTTLGPYQFRFVNTESADGPNYRGIRANVDVTKQQYHIVLLKPEKRIYTVREMVMTNVDIHPSFFRDLYIALGEPLDQNHWSMRLYYKPFVRFIWFGGIIMILGGLFALRQRTSRTT